MKCRAERAVTICRDGCLSTDASLASEQLPATQKKDWKADPQARADRRASARVTEELVDAVVLVRAHWARSGS